MRWVLVILLLWCNLLLAKEREFSVPFKNSLSHDGQDLKDSNRGSTYSHFLNALMLEQYGKLDSALNEYNRALELEPSAAVIYRQRANLHLKRGSPEKALEDAQVYVKAHPEDVEARLLLSEIHLLLGQKAAAQLVLENILDNDPGHVETMMNMATLMMTENSELSIDLFNKVLKLDPLSPEAHYHLGLLYQKQGDSQKSKAMFEKVIQIDPNSLPALVILAQISQREGAPDEAVRYYQDALKKMPENFALRMQLLLLFADKKEMSKIEELLENYKEGASVPAEANLWLGVVYEYKKEPQKALQYYLRAQKQMDNADLNLRLAGLYSQLGRSNEAIKSLRRLVQKSPDQAQFRYFLGLAYMDLKKPGKALKEFQAAAALRRDFSSAYFQMGVAYDSLKKWEPAEKMFQQAIQVDTANASAYNYLGYTYADRNERLDEARKLIEKSLELDYDNPAYLDSLGWLNFREGRPDIALSHLQSAAEKMPDPIIYDHIGDCYSSLGNLSEAAQSYSKSLELDRSNKKVQEKLSRLNRRMVPTSPARKILKRFQFRTSRNPHLSGSLLFRVKGALSALSPNTALPGFFYFRKEEELGPSSASFHSELRVDLYHQPLLPPIIFRYKNDSPALWDIFPPEFKSQFPREFETIFEIVASFIDGSSSLSFDNLETEVIDKRGFFILKNGGRTLTLDKKKETVSSISDAERSVEVSHYKKMDGLWLPQRMELRWQGRDGNRLVWRGLEIEFTHLSLDEIDGQIFGVQQKSLPQ